MTENDSFGTSRSFNTLRGTKINHSPMRSPKMLRRSHQIFWGASVVCCVRQKHTTKTKEDKTTYRTVSFGDRLLCYYHSRRYQIASFNVRGRQTSTQKKERSDRTPLPIIFHPSINHIDLRYVEIVASHSHHHTSCHR